MLKLLNIFIVFAVFIFNSFYASANESLIKTTEVSAQSHSAADGYFHVFSLTNDMSVIVEEGRLEPRSIGSISVKLYRDLEVGDFIAGITFPRDGTISNVSISNDTDVQQLTITTVTAGSGRYQLEQKVCITDTALQMCGVNHD
ncbi:PliI family lysozyme inhibitor of I-type lysozyme [Shewanella sp. OMA3-2]|uniref:PliI family lysozyme inhibitor of I-type lysozyme n=1 Tax=Shewanella sp. OMA3-2 TaxID=2908650 RepID=UPI001F1F9D67|nr:PliI family lysozyme inhibitor of I-type lysozyme [Shewanella sp. OMA3-2]UJF20520.1 PliI family lysozyme inhibitor of I-type lysozyme [Shewanella sp. OMA3-2]